MFKAFEFCIPTRSTIVPDSPDWLHVGYSRQEGLFERTVAALATIMIVAASLVAPARAAPPTVTPSPGYDARLQEQRKAMSPTPSNQSAVTTNPATTRHHHAKRTRAH
jgi:hypothetical protein